MSPTPSASATSKGQGISNATGEDHYELGLESSQETQLHDEGFTPPSPPRSAHLRSPDGQSISQSPGSRSSPRPSPPQLASAPWRPESQISASERRISGRGATTPIGQSPTSATQYPAIPSPVEQSRRQSRQVITVYADLDEDEADGERRLTVRETVRSMMHLALTAAPLSMVLSLYTIAVVITSWLLSPLRLCSKSSPTLATRIGRLLRPSLNFHRRCIFQSAVLSTSSRSSSSSRSRLSSRRESRAIVCRRDAPVTGLILVLLAAPIVAVPLFFCAWVMGTAWALGAIVSDEEAGDVMYERRFAERVVSWWAWWLDKGVSSGRESDLRETGRGRRREMRQTGGSLPV